MGEAMPGSKLCSLSAQIKNLPFAGGLRELVVQIILVAVFVLSFTAVKAEAGRKTTTFQVQGMTCGSCLGAIRAELGPKKGITGMTADLERGLVTVEYPQNINEEEIARIISQLGYPARVLREGNGQTEAPAKRCGKDCNMKGCAASASSWRDLYRKIF